MKRGNRFGMSQLMEIALAAGRRPGKSSELAARLGAQPEPAPTPEELEAARVRSETKLAKAEAKRERRAQRRAREKWSPCMKERT